MPTSLKLDLLSEIQRSSKIGLKNFLLIISKDSASGKKDSENLPSHSYWAPGKCDYFAGVTSKK